MTARTFAIWMILLPLAAQAQPSTGYDTATPTAAGSSISDFVFKIDLSRMSSSWWSAAENVDGRRGRIWNDDGVTRYEADWVEYDDTAETGLVVFLADASTSPDTVRVYPPVSGNTIEGDTDTYGRHNAYPASLEGYWPFGGGDDRTSNNNDGTANGGVTVGGATGQVGSATQFDGTDDWFSCGSNILSSAVGTLIATVRLDDFDTNMGIGGIRVNDNDEFSMFVRDSPDNTLVGSSWNARVESSALSSSTWYHTATQVDDVNSHRELWLDGVSQGTGTSTSFSTFSPSFQIGTRGANSLPMDGRIQHVMLYSVGSSAIGTDFISYRNNMGDQSAFWGTWTWNAPGGSALPVIADYYRRLRN